MNPVQLRVLRVGLAVLAAWGLSQTGAWAQGNPIPTTSGTTGPGQTPTMPIPMPGPPARAPTEVTPPTGPTQPAPPPLPANSGPPPSPPVLPPNLMTRAPTVVTGPPDPKNPRTWLWDYRMPGFTDKDYQTAVNALVADFEKRTGKTLAPGKYRKAGLKVMTGVAGLTTQPGLVRAVINALVARGFKPGELFIIDQNESRLRDAGFLPPLGSDADNTFAGVPVLVLNSGRYYDAKWNYDSPLPAPDSLVQAAQRQQYEWKVITTDRLSLLPVPLMLGLDFWINLPVGVDQPSLGLVGALANGSLYASSNTARFLQSTETGAVAVAEIAAVPELVRGWVFSILSLEQYQYLGGPRFNSQYTQSEPTLLLSANPVVLDAFLWGRMNWWRKDDNMPQIDKPSFLDYAKQLDLGDYESNRIFLVRMPK